MEPGDRGQGACHIDPVPSVESSDISWRILGLSSGPKAFRKPAEGRLSGRGGCGNCGKTVGIYERITTAAISGRASMCWQTQPLPHTSSHATCRAVSARKCWSVTATHARCAERELVIGTITSEQSASTSGTSWIGATAEAMNSLTCVPFAAHAIREPRTLSRNRRRTLGFWVMSAARPLRTNDPSSAGCRTSSGRSHE